VRLDGWKPPVFGPFPTWQRVAYGYAAALVSYSRPAAERFPNDDEATRYLDRAYRHPWRL